MRYFSHWLFFAVITSSLISVAGPLRVGVGVVDITPYDFDHFATWGGVHMGGFSPWIPFVENRLAEGVHDPIWARSLAFESDGKTIVIVSTDLPGLTWKHINPVRRRIQNEFGIPVGNIVIASTHNHQAPDAAGFWTTLMPDHNKVYTDQLKIWMYESIKEALSNRQPALMKTVTTAHYSCYDPNTLELKKDPDCRLPNDNREYEKNPMAYDQWIMQRDQRDPIVRNTRIVASQFINKSTGETIGTFVNWSDHPDSLGSTNHLISSDFPNYLREFIEAKLGGRAIYFSGTVGCQIGALRDLPVPLWSENMERVYDETKPTSQGFFVKLTSELTYEKTRSIGYEAASSVVDALNHEVALNDGADIWIKTEAVDIVVDNFLHTLATGSVWNNNVEVEDEMRTDSWRCMSLLGCVRTDVSVIQIGELGVVTSPGEMDPAYLYGRKASVVDYGEKWGPWTFAAMPGLDTFMPGRHHAVLGQANNYLSYLIHESDFLGWANFDHPNHYEDFVTVSRHFGDDAGNKIMQLLGSEIRYSKREIVPGSGTGGLADSLDLSGGFGGFIGTHGSPQGSSSPPTGLTQLLERINKK